MGLVSIFIVSNPRLCGCLCLSLLDQFSVDGIVVAIHLCIQEHILFGICEAEEVRESVGDDFLEGLARNEIFGVFLCGDLVLLDGEANLH